MKQPSRACHVPRLPAEPRGDQHALSRRKLIAAGMATGAALMGAAYLGGRSARAAGKDVLISMSGGSFMKNWQTEILDPLRKKSGINGKMVSGNIKAHAMSLLASKGEPPFDVFLGNGDDYLKLVEAGLMLPLAPDKCPSIKDVHPKFKDQWGGLGALFDYSSVGIACRSDQVKTPPASWRELVERTAKGDFGKNVFFNSLPAGVRGAEVMLVMERAFGGNSEALDGAFDAVKRMKPNILKFFTSFNDPVVLLTNGEASLGTGWDGRTFVAEDETSGKIRWIRPAEGAASNGPVIGVVKGGNEAAAYAVVDYALSAEAQKPFCENMFYGSVNTKVTYTDKLASRIPTIDGVSIADERLIARNAGKWIDRWNREIAV